nr:MAG TPA: hypothetical protein [Caudoviricetes sp.]
MHQKNGRYYLRGWGMRGGKQCSTYPPKNQNKCLVSLRLIPYKNHRR